MEKNQEIALILEDAVRRIARTNLDIVQQKMLNTIEVLGDQHRNWDELNSILTRIREINAEVLH